MVIECIIIIVGRSVRVSIPSSLLLMRVGSSFKLATYVEMVVKLDHKFGNKLQSNSVKAVYLLVQMVISLHVYMQK